LIRVLVPLADGVEEMEAVIIIDVLRRAKWSVTAAAVADGLTVRASRGVGILADARWSEVRGDDFDALIIPGGMGGTTTLAQHEGVKDLVRRYVDRGKLVGAICAGPLVLQAAGVLGGRRVTCHPGERDNLTTPAAVSDEAVVCDGRIVTSRGPGTTFAFALTVIEMLGGPELAAAVRKGLVL
jgi:4-methyl-5(b-hydroxyethyl)-thiazole monophosphate biosynthesis